MPPLHERDPFLRHALTATIVVIVAVLLVFALYYTFDILLLIFAAGLLAIFLRGVAELLGNYIKLSDGWLVLIVSILLVIVTVGFIALLSPSIADQVGVLRVKLPASIGQVGTFLSHYTWGQTLLANLPNFESIFESLSFASVMMGVGGFFSSTVGVVGNTALVILIAIYLATEPNLYLRGLLSVFPSSNRERLKDVLHAIYETLRWWLIGKAGSMIFIGVLTWIGLSILGVPLALTLGIIAGLLSFIPNFGPIISAVPAILLAFVDSPISALYVLALYVGVQLLESNVVTPFIERETVELPPALTIVFQLVLGVLVGGLGLVLATPLLAAVVVAVQLLYLEDVLGDHSTAPAIEKADADERAEALQHE